MKKLTLSRAVELVEKEMTKWLGPLPRQHKASIRLFSLRLPPDRLVEALWIAQSRIPEGGEDAFKYFCGVCHSMIRERRAAFSRN